MGFFSFIYDNTSNKKRAIAYPGFHDYVETVSGSAKAEFTLNKTITADHKIDISIDGRDQPVEDTQWSRDVETNKITMSEAIPVGKTFKARIYLI